MKNKLREHAKLGPVCLSCNLRHNAFPHGRLILVDATGLCWGCRDRIRAEAAAREAEAKAGIKTETKIETEKSSGEKP